MWVFYCIEISAMLKSVSHTHKQQHCHLKLGTECTLSAKSEIIFRQICRSSCSWFNSTVIRWIRSDIFKVVYVQILQDDNTYKERAEWINLRMMLLVTRTQTYNMNKEGNVLCWRCNKQLSYHLISHKIKTHTFWKKQIHKIKQELSIFR